MGLVYLVLIGNYYTVSPENMPEWGQRILDKCGTAVLEDSKISYETRGMLDNGQTAFGFGAYLGLLFRAKHFANISLQRDEQ